MLELMSLKIRLVQSVEAWGRPMSEKRGRVKKEEIWDWREEGSVMRLEWEGKEGEGALEGLREALVEGSCGAEDRREV